MKGLIRFMALGGLLLLGGSLALAQLDSVGGPYTPDAHTMLLMHFDGDYSNVGKSANGVRRGNPAAQFFIPGITGLGQCLRIQNDNQTDTSYVTIADSASLDLTGDWTIEGWVNIFTFGAYGSWNWVPRLVIKPGDDVFWHPNYFVEMWGDVRKFSCGYWAGPTNPPAPPAGPEGGEWPQANSPNNSFTQAQWVHLTFLRDLQRKFVATLVHDENRQLLFYTVYFIDTLYQKTPMTNSQNVYIGWAGTPTDPSVDSYLDGFVDEIRISDVMRKFPVPPIIHSASQLAQRFPSGQPQTIDAVAEAFISGATISSVRIRYNIGSGWQEVVMSNTGGMNYSGALPAMPTGTKGRAYVVAYDNYNLRSVYPSTAEFDTTTQYSFAVYAPNTQTLHLTFEEGPGVKPVDHSSYNEPVTTFRIPDYSTDAKVGTYSLLLQNDPLKIDSNWVEVDPTFVGADEFCLDLWVKPDSAKNKTSVISLPAAASMVGPPVNYDISFKKKAIGADTYFDAIYNKRVGGALVEFLTNVKAAIGSWYHLVFERSKANNRSVFQVRDASDILLGSVAKVDSTPVLGTYPLRVGRGYTGTGNYWDIPPFRGKMDDVKIYNYPAAGITGVNENAKTSIPLEFALQQNYPNPFNPTTEIQFSIPKSDNVRLVVYDILGRQIRSLVDETMHAGEHHVRWNGLDDAGRGVATGLYFYSLKSGDRTAVRKMMLLR